MTEQEKEELLSIGVSGQEIVAISKESTKDVAISGEEKVIKGIMIYSIFEGGTINIQSYLQRIIDNFNK